MSTTEHTLNKLKCYPQISSLVLQATNTHIFGFKLTTLIQPLLGVMEAQVLKDGNIQIVMIQIPGSRGEELTIPRQWASQSWEINQRRSQVQLLSM